MKATGEVMAIDRTFGSALNKALRGLEQAGAGPLAEDPSWTPSFDYLAGVYGGRPDGGRRRPRTTQPIRWIDETGQACESTRHAQRTAAPIVLRRFLAPSDSRLWRLLGLLRRGVPEADDPGGDRHRAVVPRRDGPERRAGAGGPGDPRPPRRPRRTPRPPRCSRPSSGRASATASSRRWPGSRRRRSATRAMALGLRPGYAMVDTCAAEFAAETPYFYATYAAAGLGARGAAGPAARRPRHRQRPGPDRAGDRVRLLRGPGRRHAPPGAAGRR